MPERGSPQSRTSDYHCSQRLWIKQLHSSRSSQNNIVATSCPHRFILATMMTPWSFSAAFRLVLVLLATSLSATVASSPWAHDQEVIVDDQQHIKACVFGSPKKYDQWTIQYHEVKPLSQFASQFVLDPAWVARHQTVGDIDVSAASSTFPMKTPSSNTPSISPWVLLGSHGPRIDASIAATRGTIVFRLSDIRVRILN